MDKKLYILKDPKMINNEAIREQLIEVIASLKDVNAQITKLIRKHGVRKPNQFNIHLKRTRSHGRPLCWVIDGAPMIAPPWKLIAEYPEDQIEEFRQSETLRIQLNYALSALMSEKQRLRIYHSDMGNLENPANPINIPE